MKIRRVGWGYEMVANKEIKYTIIKGGWGWNLYKGADILMGQLDAYRTLKEAKEYVMGI